MNCRSCSSTNLELLLDLGEQEHVHCHIKSTEEWVKYVQSYGFEILDPPFALNRAGDTAEIFTRRMR
jgi:hypothetical protein